MITLTKAAIAKLIEISHSEGIGHYCVRISLRGGGCAGMMHDMNFDDVQKENDEVIEQDSIKLFIDPVSYQYMQNTTIDWEDRLIASGFKFTSPDINGSCGCGKSVSY